MSAQPRSLRFLRPGARRDLGRELKQFRATHPLTRLYFADHRWDYISCGKGPRALTLLTGADGVAESWFKHILEFESDYRIIAPNYPCAGTMTELIDGLAQILEMEKIESTELLAASFGGMLAQCFIRLYPSRVANLILSNTTFPDRRYARRLRRNLTVMTILPWGLTWRTIRMQMTRLVNAPPDEQDFWQSFFVQQFAHQIDKRLVTSLERCMVDFATNYRFRPEELDSWPGRILIIESDTDPYFKSRVSLKALYPKAQVHTFFGAGHVPAISRRDQFNSVVRNFLREPGS